MKRQAHPMKGLAALTELLAALNTLASIAGESGRVIKNSSPGKLRSLKRVLAVKPGSVTIEEIPVSLSNV
jgi:hypothetical protein